MGRHVGAGAEVVVVEPEVQMVRLQRQRGLETCRGDLISIGSPPVGRISGRLCPEVREPVKPSDGGQWSKNSSKAGARASGDTSCV